VFDSESLPVIGQLRHACTSTSSRHGIPTSLICYLIPIHRSTLTNANPLTAPGHSSLGLTPTGRDLPPSTDSKPGPTPKKAPKPSTFPSVKLHHDHDAAITKAKATLLFLLLNCPSNGYLLYRHCICVLHRHISTIRSLRVLHNRPIAVSASGSRDST
jgi:hypothetical protein